MPMKTTNSTAPGGRTMRGRDFLIGIFVVVLFVNFSFSLPAEIPVVDFQVFKQAYEAFIEGDGIFDKLKFQLRLLQLLKEKIDIFTGSVLHTLEKLTWEEVEKTMAFDTYIYLEPGYFLIDKYQQEIWYRIFKKIERITDVYDIGVDSVYQENPLYKKYPKVREFMDRAADLQKEHVRDLLNLVGFFADNRDIQCIRAESIKQWNVASKLFSSPLKSSDIKAFEDFDISNNTLSQHKVIFLIARLELENLKQKLERNVMKRSLIEMEIKSKIREDDLLKTFLNEQMKEVNAK